MTDFDEEATADRAAIRAAIMRGGNQRRKRISGERKLKHEQAEKTDEDKRD